MAGVDEYVVKLGTLIDNKGIQTILDLLNKVDIKSMAVTAAFTAATTAVYKFVKGAAETEQALAKLADKQKKSVDETRASEMALKSMGKTMDDIKKDKALKATYEDLKKLNMELKFPDMKKSLNAINTLKTSFWELKDVLGIGAQLIGANVLNNLVEPLQRINGLLNNITKWVRDNLSSITTKVSSYITGFAKGITTVVESFAKVLSYVQKIDPAIRQVGTAIAIVAAAIKTGPLGELMTIMTAIGGLVDDFENWQWNKTQDAANQVGVAFGGIWEKLFPDNGEADFEGAASLLFDSIIEGLNSITELVEKIDIWKAFEDVPGGVGGILDSITTYLSSDEASLKIGAVFHSFAEALKKILVKGGDAASDIAGLIIQMFTGKDLDKKVEEAFKDNSVTAGLSTGVLMKLLGFGDLASIAGGIVSLFGNAREEAIAELAKSGNNAPTEEQISNAMFAQMGLDFVPIAEFIVGGIGEALRTVNIAGGTALETLIKAIFGSGTGDGTDFVDKIMKELQGEDGNNALFGGLATSIGMMIGGVGIGGSIIGGIASALSQYLNDPDGLDALKEDIDDFVEAFNTLMFGEWTDETKTERTGEGLWKTLGPIFDTIKEKIHEAFEGDPDNPDDGILGWIKGIWESVTTWIDDNVFPYFSYLFSKIGNLFKGWYYEFTSSGVGKAIADTFGLEYGGMSPETYVLDGNGNITTVSQLESQGVDAKTIGKYIQNSGDNEAIRTLNEGSRYINYDPSTGQINYNYVYGAFGNSHDNEPFKNALLLYQNALREGNQANIVRYGSALNEYNSSVHTGTIAPVIGYNNDSLKGLNGKDIEVPVTGVINRIYIGGDVEQPELEVNGIERRTHKKAWGGRIGSEMNNVTVGEDGPEYIIPITKPGRAISLIKQMIGEMGGGVLNQIIGDFGIGGESTIGSSMASIASALGAGAGSTSTVNVSAPVNINVSASGVAAEDVGQRAYDAAQRHQLRTLRGVFA